MPATIEDYSNILTPGVCDFCRTAALVYTDPETKCPYCISCLEITLDPANQIEEDPEALEIEDPEIMAIAHIVIAELLAETYITKGNQTHANH